MSVITNNLLLGEDGYNISRSVRLRSSATAYFNRTSGTPTNKDVWTYSGWIKYSTGKYFPFLYALSGGFYEYFEIDNTGAFFWITRNSAGSVFKQYYTASGQRLFRDPSAWYHIVVRKTAALTLQFYVNGEEFTLTPQTVGSPSSSLNTASTSHTLGFEGFSSVYADGYMTETNFIDGQALTPSSFGETDAVTGVWKPKKYAGTYGTNGFYLNFSDPSAATAAAIGKDYSGNGNNWTPNNISVTSGVTYDSMLDVPTLGPLSSNHCVMNPLASLSGRTSFSAGNLQVLGTSSGESGVDYGTIGVTSGKWYWESTVLAVSSASSYPNIGAVRVLYGPSNGKYAGDSFTGGAGIFTGGGVYKEGSLVTTVSTYTTNDVIGIALDVDNLTCAFYKNGTLLTTVTGLTAGTYWAGVGSYYNSSTAINFGQRPFAYTPPTGFKALNTQNLPAGSITTSGSFTGNTSSDGPFVYLNGVPTAMTINGNAVTFATHVDKTANGFKVRSSSSSYNASGSNTYSITTTGAKFKYANAQGNP